MNFDFWVTKPEYTEGAVELITFLLRFHTHLDYEAFSDKADVISILKRSEMLKCWNDIEELANGVDIFHKRCVNT